MFDNLNVYYKINIILKTVLNCIFQYAYGHLNKYTQIRTIYFQTFSLQMHPMQIKNKPWGTIKRQISRDKRC